MNWTTDKPTKPGYYWIMEPNNGLTFGRYLKDQYRYEAPFEVLGGEETMYYHDFETGVEFYGPINPPNEDNKR